MASLEASAVVLIVALDREESIKPSQKSPSPYPRVNSFLQLASQVAQAPRMSCQLIHEDSLINPVRFFKFRQYDFIEYLHEGLPILLLGHKVLYLKLLFGQRLFCLFF